MIIKFPTVSNNVVHLEAEKSIEAHTIYWLLVDCLGKYLGDVEVKILDKAINDYGSIISDGYDGKFKIFERQIKALLPMQLKEAMGKAESSGFWTCQRLDTVVR
jgi:hypothetical protein